MVVFLGRSSTLGWAWLCYHLLLCRLVTPLATPTGDLCFFWTSPQKSDYHLFWCPDGVEGKFCCGTCSKPYCCSSAKDRLDIQQCFPDSDSKDRRTTDAPQVEIVHLPSALVSYFISFIISFLAIVLASLVVIYGWDLWQSRNRDRRQIINQEENIPMAHMLPEDRDEAEIPFCDEIEDIPITFQPTSNSQPVASSGDGNASFQGEGAQPSTGSQSDSAQGMEGPSSTHVLDSSQILVHFDAEESHDTGPQATPSTGNNLPSDDAPLDGVEDPNDCLGLAASQTLGLLEDSPDPWLSGPSEDEELSLSPPATADAPDSGPILDQIAPSLSTVVVSDLDLPD